MKKGEGLNTLVFFRDQGMQEKEVGGGGASINGGCRCKQKMKANALHVY